MSTSPTLSLRVGVVVLAYDGLEHTRACLDSLRAADWPDIDVIVVDNASTDGTAARVAAEFPEVELVRHARNVGFSAGNNAGVRRALERGADHVLLLNNDTTVAPDCITLLVEATRAAPESRILSPLVLYAEPDDVVWYAGAEWSPSRLYNGSYIGQGERDTGQFAGVRPTDCATGAAMLVPRAVIERIGVLPEEFFLQTEDVEYSARARQAGIGIAVVGEARVWHHVSQASGGEHSPLVVYYGTRNSLEVARRYGGLRRPRSWLHEIGLTLLFAAHARRSPRPAESLAAVLAGWRDFRTRRLGRRAPADPLARRGKVALKRALGVSGVKTVKVLAGPARGVSMTLDFSGGTPMFLGMFEWELHSFFSSVLTDAALVLDVGGYVGYDALLFAQNSPGRVITFEPSATQAEVLRANLVQNPGLAARIDLDPRFVGAEDGEGRVSIDALALTAGPPDVIKIDIDGDEADALRGALATLRDRRPHLVVETHSLALERECGRILVECGYLPVVKHNRRVWREHRGGAPHNRWLLAHGRTAGG